MITIENIKSICDIYFTKKFILNENLIGYTVSAIDKNNQTISCFFEKSKITDDSYIETIEDMIYGMVKYYDLQ